MGEERANQNASHRRVALPARTHQNHFFFFRQGHHSGSQESGARNTQQDDDQLVGLKRLDA